MSVLLRDAVRELLQHCHDVGLEETGRLADLRRLVDLEQRADGPVEPAIARSTDVHVTALVTALRRFQKPGGHAIGCSGLGFCTETCRLLQAALTPERAGWADSTVHALTDTILALDRERRALLVKVKGLQRKPGRPKKSPPVVVRKTQPIQRRKGRKPNTRRTMRK